MNVPVNYTVERSQLNVLDKNVTIPPIDINTEDDEGNENTLVKLDINSAKYIDDFYIVELTENGAYYNDFIDNNPGCFVKRFHYRVNVPTGIQLPIDINAFSLLSVSSLIPGAEQLINDSDFSNCTTDNYSVSIPSNSILLALPFKTVLYELLKF